MFKLIWKIIFLFLLVIFLNSCCPRRPGTFATTLRSSIKEFKKYVNEDKNGFAYYYLSSDTRDRYPFSQFDHALENKKELRELIDDVELEKIQYLDGKDEKSATKARVTFFTKKFDKRKSFIFRREEEEIDQKQNGEVKKVKLKVWKLIFHIKEIEKDLKEWQEERRKKNKK